ncbi:bifunctional 4-hydroxy-2-oxoglutarate aldolase/2-dehydro-3-deoxy-phosphogluconate aldolase [Microbacterium marinum]|uniref:bifunctional 4-hydroxy-2-oxoglutarate aldolase/2-dehydro-3-deoxy-phosphogluconate aldolase n=1 Tax=Microbacterium marinum TaxID=421115 RepID=UPI00384BCD76
MGERLSLSGTALERTGVVAVLRAPSFDAYLPVVETLISSGVTCIELTLTTPQTIEQFASLRTQLPETCHLGVGTVTTVDQAARAIDAGADFLVTPVTNTSLVDIAVARGVPIFPGSMSPSEVFANWSANATAVKVFPAATVGPDFLRQLHGPFPDIALIPSGGVGLTDIPDWVAAGAVAVSLGGPLVGGAFGGESLSQLKLRASRALELVAEARS